MSGSICEPTGCRTESSKPTATSSTLPAKPGTSSPPCRPSYNPSECANGPTTVNHEGRWYYFLLDLAERGRSDVVEMPMSRTDIGDYLGLMMETDSRILTQFVRDAVIGPGKYRRQIVILNKRALQRMIEGTS